MSVAVAITRMDLSAAELRMAAATTRNANVARRLLALALVPGRRQPDRGGSAVRHGPSDTARLGAPL